MLLLHKGRHSLIARRAKSEWLPRLLVLCVLPLAFEGNASSQQITEASPAELAIEIGNAAADQPYGVELRLSRPASVGEIRTVSTQLRIPRGLAYVEYGDLIAGRPRGLQILGLGEMYASDSARQYWECRALVGVNIGENELRNSPIDEWPVSKIHVYATAHIIRELLSGRLLPPATIVDGAPGTPGDLRILEEQVPNELAQPISQPRDVELPDYCSKFVGVIDSPILARDFPRGFLYPEALEGEDFRDHAFRLLGQLPRDTAVTIDLKLDLPANVELLASLVQDYDIRGMRADLVPERSTQRMSVDAELSTLSGDMSAQIHRVRCQMRIGLGGVEPQASSEWYADWISVSLSTEDAVRFLSYPNLAQARVTGSHPLAELGRLQGYYESLATRTPEIPRSMEIPPGCESLYIHNDQDEVGSIVALPPN